MMTRFETKSLYLKDCLVAILIHEKIAHEVSFDTDGTMILNVECKENRLKSVVGQWRRAVNQLSEELS